MKINRIGNHVKVDDLGELTLLLDPMTAVKVANALKEGAKDIHDRSSDKSKFKEVDIKLEDTDSYGRITV